MTDDELREWANSHEREYPYDGECPVSVAIRRLLDEKRRSQELEAKHVALIHSQAERIAAQSALLSKRAEEVAVLGKRAEAILDSPLMGFGMTEEQMQAILDTLWPGSCNEDGSAHRFAAGALTCYCGQFENPFDGSTGMSSTIAGRKSQGSGA